MYIGIDLGGTNIAAGLVNDECEIIASKSVPTCADVRTGEEIVKAMAELALDLCKENNVDTADIQWVGIGAPGTIDSENGIIAYANNIRFFNTPAAKIFRETFDVPVYLGNDANCAALGEAYAGAAKNARHAIMITLGTGLGGGIIIDKKIYAGFNGAGGEIGHSVIVKDGRQCSCGRKGCWEAYSSATGLINMTVDAMKTDTEKKSLLWKVVKDGKIENVSGRTAYLAAKEGDELALSVTNAYEEYLASGIATVINIFQPEVFCIGGGVSHEGDRLMNPVRKLVSEQIYTRTIADLRQTEVKLAELGNNAGIVGAAMLGK
ncbi:MAG: ROK family glucokinase [Clostridiales bacterium]|nr:ROK family glucokinase [Clostridiales bacterium]